MDNATIARILGEMADLLEIKGENPFKIRAFRNAALTVESLGHDLSAVARAAPEKLRAIPGIGAGIAAKIVEMGKTGDCDEHRLLLAEYPPTLLELLEIGGVGPKKAKVFFEALGVADLDALEKAARDGRLLTLPKMKEKTVANILRGIEGYRGRAGRFLISQAEAIALRVVEWLKRTTDARIGRIEPAGSLRRRKDTIGDVDIVVTCDTPAAAVMDRYVAFPDVLSVLGKGDTKSSVKLRSGLQVDVRVVEAQAFGAAMHYFTGSKAHNIAIRGLAVDRGLTVSEYGVFTKDGNRRQGGEDEADIFRAVGLPWIPPELRENRGEIEAARDGRLPRLIEGKDIRGDLHMHTKETDGAETAEAMAEAAAALGREYVAITDHSKALAFARGLDEARVRAQAAVIREAQAKVGRRIRVLHGIEVDILADGALDLERDALAALDVVVASVHSRMDLPKEEQTARVIRAIESGSIDIVGHPTARKLGKREPIELDLERVFAAAKAHGVALEISAYPDRLDLSDTNARLAKEMGAKLVISTDSHQTVHLENMRFGVDTARRAWLERDDVLNTRPVGEFLAGLHEGHRP